MSTSRGSNVRKRPQKYQNRTAFKNDLHDTSHKTKFLNCLEVTGVCKRCKDVIKWKINYKKYKALNVPRKCLACEQKTVKYAYHMMCTPCSKDKRICAKCCKPVEGQDSKPFDDNLNTDLKTLLKDLSERKRRTIIRHLNKQADCSQKVPSDVKAQIENMLLKIDNIKLDDDLNLSDDDYADSDEQIM